MKKPKKLTNAQLKKKLDKIYSEFIRRSSADKNGFSTCYTCGKKAHWKELQCGHFISRSSLATRFLETNTKVQCIGCNIFGGGKQVQFAQRLQDDYGKGIVEKLYREAQKIIRYYPYEQMIGTYEQKLKDLSDPIKS